MDFAPYLDSALVGSGGELGITRHSLGRMKVTFSKCLRENGKNELYGEDNFLFLSFSSLS